MFTVEAEQQTASISLRDVLLLTTMRSCLLPPKATKYRSSAARAAVRLASGPLYPAKVESGFMGSNRILQHSDTRNFPHTQRTLWIKPLSTTAGGCTVILTTY